MDVLGVQTVSPSMLTTTPAPPSRTILPPATITTAATKTIFVTVSALSAPSLILTPTSRAPFTLLPTVWAPAPTNSITTDASSAPTHTGGITHPNDDQVTIIWVAGVMLLSIMVGWNMILIRSILYPWKMLVNLIHEASHVFVAILTGANVYSVTIDPDKGPISAMTAGQPFVILSAGYLGSILVGSAMIMTAFDISASKITCLVLFPLLVVCFWFGRIWARIQILGCIGITIGMWFIDHASYLRYHILFVGVMCAFYVLWDAFDDLLFRKENESDAALFARMSSPTIHAWVLIWLCITLVFVSLAVLGGLHFFNNSVEAQRQAQVRFLPT